MSDVVISTAGHIDHGKTCLVKALTGIETDTTREERQRGMSINLGFAYLDLPSGQRVGIVDVPGHERFIKNMVAGLPGISLVLLVIDAAEGIMPQTEEHLDILGLLGIQNILVVLTKVDTVDQDLKMLVIEDIRARLRDTPIKDETIIETDAITGTGIKELIDVIDQRVAHLPALPSSGFARLNIDRAFTIKGFGCIVTGTLLDGPIHVDDDLFVCPGDKHFRVRSIQVHETAVQKALPGQRTALNLSHARPGDVQRGDVLSTSQKLTSTWMFDAKLSCLPSAEQGLGLWDRVRLLIGTREVMARIVPLGIEQIEPSKEGFAQLRLEKPITVRERDRFIIRSYSPMRTIGGGEVLDVAPNKHRRFKRDIIEHLTSKASGKCEDIVYSALETSGKSFVKLQELRESLGMAQDELQQALEDLVKSGKIIETTAGYLCAVHYQNLKEASLSLLSDYHKRYPLLSGMPLEEFRSRMRDALPERTCSVMINLLIDEHLVAQRQHRLALAKFTPHYNAQQETARKLIEHTLDEHGFAPCERAELIKLDPHAEEVLEALSGAEIIFLSSTYVIAASYYQRSVELVRAHIAQHGRITLAEFRDMTQTSRKSSALLLEYMDMKGITVRIEDYRILGEHA